MNVMHYIELLKANNKDYKFKFISVLKDECSFDTKELSSMYDVLLDSKKVIIRLKKTDLNSLNKIALEIIDLDINIGESSFHEEDMDNA